MLIEGMEGDDIKRPERVKLKKTKDKDAEKGERKRKRKISKPVEALSKHNPNSPSRKEPVATTALDDLTNYDSFFHQTYSLYLPLAPIYQQLPLPGLCAEHLSPLLLVYYPPFQGVIVSYSNPRFDPTPDVSAIDGRQKAYARSIDEYAATFTWLTAEFLVFRPQKGSLIEGHLILQSESTIGLVCLNFFNASIDRRRLPKDWKWIGRNTRVGIPDNSKKAISSSRKNAEEGNGGIDELFRGVGGTEGYFQDGDGRRVKGMIRFRVRQMITSRSTDRENSFLGIEGTMLDDEDEYELQEKDDTDILGSQNGSSGDRNERGKAMSGALMDSDENAVYL